LQRLVLVLLATYMHHGWTGDKPTAAGKPTYTWYQLTATLENFGCGVKINIQFSKGILID
jgi:hypothetical protein